MYRKEIIYMALHKDGSRMGSAGFLKVENRDQTSSLYLKVKNIPHSIHGRFPIRFYNGADWKEVDGITLQEGSGMWEENESEVLRQVRLQIILPGGYLIEGISKEAQQKDFGGRTGVPGEKEMGAPEESVDVPAEEGRRTVPVPKVRENASVEEGRVSAPVPSIKGSASVGEERRTAPVPGEKEDAASGGKIERIPIQRQKAAISETIPAANVNATASVELPPPMADEMRLGGVKEDKWEQILDTYDQIHPYGDERIYVKLEPKDFVILQAKYQHLVNNSFLLHGFYNYRYIILGKENGYYLGVPGVFYEREKMVALMFGFEAFECTGGEAKPGEFGYYLRKVEL